MPTYQSWGRYPRAKSVIRPVPWRCDPIFLPSNGSNLSYLPYGLGRSYGDCCLNDGGVLLDTHPLNHWLSFDRERGILRAESGVTFEEILELIVPAGFFVPVTPGTKYVTLGGAIANDVHGKNHHREGTFGRSVRCFGLLRSTGERLVCSNEQNSDLFRATIGGVGLTGLITWAEIQLKKIQSPLITEKRIPFRDYREFIELSQKSDHDFEYTVAWFDCLARGASLGRGIFIGGNHADAIGVPYPAARSKKPIGVPFDAPSFLLNRLSMKIFNNLFYALQSKKTQKKTIPYNNFFYPLDCIGNWNRLYGRKGFFQYQCVIPIASNPAPLKEILETASRGATGSFLAVMKYFGGIESPGLLSFPRKGITLTLDYPNRGKRTLELFDRLDRIVVDAGGAVYPAKDARMSGESFRKFFPRYAEFARWIDPKFSSSFWRRVSR